MASMYVLRRCVVYVNLSNETIDLASISGSRFIDSAPQEDFNQHLVGVDVYVNGVSWSNYTITWDTESSSSIIVVEGLPRKLKPGEELNITMVFTVVLEDRTPPGISMDRAKDFNAIQRYAKPLLSKYTAETSLWNYSHPVIQHVLGEINGTKPLEIVLNAVKWIEEHVSYRSHVPPLKPWEVVEKGEGDCDEQANLLITLLRGKGVPARLAYGVVYMPGYVSNITASGGLVGAVTVNCGWHAWVEAYVPPWGWVPVDLTLGGEGLGHITRACIYSRPVIIMGRICQRDYVKEDVETIKLSQELKLGIKCYDSLREADPPEALCGTSIIYACIALLGFSGALACLRSLCETRYRRSLGVKA